MVRSLVAVAASVSERIVLFNVYRRGYAAAADADAGKNVERKVVADSSPVGTADSSPVGTAASALASCWVPDPLSGFYRPGYLRMQEDAAEQREILLSQKPSS